MIASAAQAGVAIDAARFREAARLYAEYQRRLIEGNAPILVICCSGQHRHCKGALTIAPVGQVDLIASWPMNTRMSLTPNIAG